MDQPTVTLPTLHMNGDSADELKRQIDAALDAGRAFEDALRAMTPNARNYYPQGDHAAHAARTEHEARRGKVSGILAELQRIQVSIYDQADERDRRRAALRGE